MPENRVSGWDFEDAKKEPYHFPPVNMKKMY